MKRNHDLESALAIESELLARGGVYAMLYRMQFAEQSSETGQLAS